MLYDRVENTEEPSSPEECPMIEDSLTWQNVKRIVAMTSLPVIAKGILTGKLGCYENPCHQPCLENTCPAVPLLRKYML